MSGDFGLPEPRAPGPAGDGGGPTAAPADDRWARVLLAGLVLVVLVGAGVVTVAVLRPAPTATALGATSTTAPPATSPPPSSGAAAPRPPGWQTVVGHERVAYDVPPTWHVEEPDTITGFEYHDDTDARLVTMHEVASYRTGACPAVPGSARARAGFVSPRGESASAAAPELSQRWAEVAALQLGGRVGNVSPTQTVTRQVSGRTGAGGAVTATESTTLVRFPLLVSACQAPAMTVSAVSFEAHGVVVAFVLWTDEQVADTVPGTDATRVLRSVRPVG